MWSRQLALASEQRMNAWNVPARPGRGGAAGRVPAGKESDLEASQGTEHWRPWLCIPSEARAGTHSTIFHPDGVDVLPPRTTTVSLS